MSNHFLQTIATLVFVAIGFFPCGQSANADVFDLTADFSDSSNPNDTWSFTRGSFVLTHFPQPSDGNPLNPAAGNGFWGVGPSFNSNVPFVLKTTTNGSAAGLTNNDFLSSDVIIHSSNSGNELFINWTAPNDGFLTYTGSIWYAHSSVNRSNNFVVQLNGGSALNSGSVTNGQGRSNPVNFNSSSTITVNAGDVLSISPFKSTGQSFGSLAGIDFSINFTAIPEPSTLGLLAVGLLAFAPRRCHTTRRRCG